MTGTAITTIRQALEFNQTEFGRLFGVSVGTVSKWESGSQVPQPLQDAILNRLGYVRPLTGWSEVKVEVRRLVEANEALSALILMLNYAEKKGCRIP